MISTTDRYMRGRTAIRATRLFDGTGTATATDPLIVVSDGRISSVDDVGPGAAVPRDAELVELPGQRCSPGWSIPHAHLAFAAVPSPVEALAGRDDEALAEMAQAAAV